jgi:hypothetical protein
VSVLRYSPAVIACPKGGKILSVGELVLIPARNKLQSRVCGESSSTYQSSQRFFDERADLFYEEVDAPYLHDPTHEVFSGTQARTTSTAREQPVLGYSDMIGRLCKEEVSPKADLGNRK